MRYIADLHVHSSFSMATSGSSNLEGFHQWARIKGIRLVGTGDFTHPGWFRDLREKLVPDGNGFFNLNEKPKRSADDLSEIHANETDVSFCLTCEISSIYKKNGSTHKVHSVIFAPDLDAVGRINSSLEKIGNIHSDGRPILGLDPKHLLEIIKTASPDSQLIPAHIWTPWFSVFGSNSGFDSIEECFEDLTEEIFALETGLSSDPAMNWRLSDLDRFALVSNSDAHSPQKLGREANIFDTDFSYEGMFRALKTGDGFSGTYEFYPEEGKYHFDGHRKCGVCLDPEESRRLEGLCPACGKPLTIGVMNRVLELSDRHEAVKPGRAPGFKYIIPLVEVISEIAGKGQSSKIVQSAYAKLISDFGSEFSLLVDTPPEDAGAKYGEVLKEALIRLRSGRINPRPGYDGEFGVIRIFSDDELAEYRGQKTLFELETAQARKPRNATKQGSVKQVKKNEKRIDRSGIRLDADQERVLGHEKGCMLVFAGPGTGKTRALISWIAGLVESEKAKPHEVLAITFTQRACREMRERLDVQLGEKSRGITIETFHGFAFNLIKSKYAEMNHVYDERARLGLLRALFPELDSRQVAKASKDFSDYMEGLGKNTDPGFIEHSRIYIETLKKAGCIDIASLITGANQILRKNPEFLRDTKARYRFIAVDELQDINLPQYELLSTLFSKHDSEDTTGNTALLAIGDPDQAIYGFRGSRSDLFFGFIEDYAPVTLELKRNYRSGKHIVEGASSVIANNERNFGKSLIPVGSQGAKIRVYDAKDPADEAAFIASVIDESVGGMRFETAKHGKAEYSFADIAILARTKHALGNIGSFLRTRSVPYQFKSEAPFVTLEPFSSIVSAFSFLTDRNNPVAIIDVLGFLFGDGAFDTRGIIASFAADTGRTDGLLQLTHAFVNPEQKEKLGQWLEYSDMLRDVIGEKGLREGIGRLVEAYPALDPETKGYVAEKESFLGLAGEYETDLAGFVRKCTLDVHEDESPFSVDKVALLTFHASKGLEFPVVIIMAAEEGMTPILSKNADIEEERRLFYVAMTRAKEKLYITHSTIRQVYAENKMMARSRFIDEITSDAREKAQTLVGTKRPGGNYQPMLFGCE